MKSLVDLKECALVGSRVPPQSFYFRNIMKDGIGQEIKVGDVVVRCGFNQYAGVQLYRVVKICPKKLVVSKLLNDRDEKVLLPHLDILKEEIRCSIDSNTVVIINDLMVKRGYQL